MNARTPSRFLSRGEYDQDARDEAIGLAAEKLVEQGAYCDPLDADNFDEALSETLAAYPAKNDLSARLVVALRAGESVNKMLVDMSHEYWHAMALRRAEDQVEAEREESIRQASEDRYEDRRDYARGI